MILGLREQVQSLKQDLTRLLNLSEEQMSLLEDDRNMFSWFEKAVKRLESKNRRLLKKLDDLQHEYDAYVLMSENLRQIDAKTCLRLELENSKLAQSLQTSLSANNGSEKEGFFHDPNADKS